MTRLFVYVRCKNCNYPYATDTSKSYVGAKGYVKGLCWRCQLKEMNDTTKVNQGRITTL